MVFGGCGDWGTVGSLREVWKSWGAVEVAGARMRERGVWVKGAPGQGLCRAGGKGETGKGVGDSLAHSGALVGDAWYLREVQGGELCLASAKDSGAVCPLAQRLIQLLHIHQTTSLLLETVQRAKCWRP